MIHQSITTPSSWRKAVVLTAAAFATIGVAFAAPAQKTDFSGNWTLNEGKSELGQYARMAPRKMNVTSKGDSLVVQRFATTPDGNETSYNDVLRFDGKETETTLFGSSKKKSTAKWSDDGQSLNVSSTILFERDGQNFEVKVAEVWKLAEGGKMLNITSTSTSQMGNNTTKLFFDKAS